MSEEKKSDIEDFWKTNAPTRNILIAIAVVYLGTTIASIIFGEGLKTANEVLYYVGQFNARILQGHVYLLITAIFVHGSILHFFSNVLFLLIYGLRAEERLYDREYYLIFFISALLGNLLTLWVFTPNTLSCGASGGIFGLLGVDLVLAHEEDSHRSLMSYAATGLIFYLLSSGAQVNYLAHGIGLISGIIIPYFFMKRRKPLKKEEKIELS